MKKTITFVIIFFAVVSAHGMGSEDYTYHWDPKLANQLYKENGCQVCGETNCGRTQCNRINLLTKTDIYNLIGNMQQFMSTQAEYAPLKNEIIETSIRTSLHPYTLKTMHDRFGADQAKAHVERAGKQTFLDFLKKKKKFMDDQLAPNSIDYHTIYVALARKIHILYIAIEILEGKLPDSTWNLKES